jgi:5-methylcytosine-specific restriction endonuclease McrA
MKQCKKCLKIKEISAFYKHYRMGDNHINFCKECKKEYSKKYFKVLRNNPIKHKKYQEQRSKRYYEKGGLQKSRVSTEKLKEVNYFKWRARSLTNLYKIKISENFLKDLLNNQEGKCILSGRNIDIKTAHLDHIIPLSRGGKNELSNFRFLCSDVNYAKRVLLDKELIDLCKDILIFIKRDGHRARCPPLSFFVSMSAGHECRHLLIYAFYNSVSSHRWINEKSPVFVSLFHLPRLKDKSKNPVKHAEA